MALQDALHQAWEVKLPKLQQLQSSNWNCILLWRTADHRPEDLEGAVQAAAEMETAQQTLLLITL